MHRRSPEPFVGFLVVLADAVSEVVQVPEPELRLEAQTAIVRLAGKQDVPALREALAKTKEPATRGVLERLIAKLEKE